MSKKFKANTLYRFKKSASLPDYGKYQFARSTDYAAGCHVADCWIEDGKGNVHPGYNVSPVPFSIESLVEVR